MLNSVKMKLLKCSISAVLLPGKDHLVFDDTSQWLIVQKWWCFSRMFCLIHISAACFPRCLAKTCPFSLKIIQQSQRPSHLLALLWCCRVDIFTPQPRPTPGSLWSALTFLSWEKQQGQLSTCGHRVKADRWVGGVHELSFLSWWWTPSFPHATRISYSLSWKTGF